MTFNFPLDWVLSLALATIRATLFFVICPPFNNRALTGQIKAFLGLALGVCTMDMVTPVQGTLEFFTQAVLQAFIGFGMGFIVYVIINFIQSAGALIDLSGGFSMAQAFDPLSMTNGATFSRLYNWMALALLFASGGYQILIMGLARSYQAVPVGAPFPWDNLANQLAYQSGQLIVAAIEIGGPLLIVLFLTDMGLGLLTRVAPALNAFALGFPLKILITVLLIPYIMVSLPQVVDNLVNDSYTAIRGVWGQ